MSHLQNIATRQRRGLIRDALFVTAVALATVLSISSVGTAVQASTVIAHR